MFGDEAKVKKNDKAFFELFNAFKEEWDGTKASLTQGDNFYKKLSENISAIGAEMDKLESFYKSENTKLIKAEANLKESTKDPAPVEVDDNEQVKQKTDELIKKIKHLDALRATMKDILKKLNGKKLASIKVNENPSLMSFFTTLFNIFYQPTNIQFDWKKFSSYAFIDDKCDEFTLKLVPADFSPFTDDQVGELDRIKNDPGVLKFGKEETNGESLLDILDYLEYVPETVITQREINALRVELQNARHEAFKKGLQVDLDIDKLKTVGENIKYHGDLHKRFSKEVSTLEEGTKKIQEIDGAYSKHRQVIATSVVEKVNGLQDMRNKKS